jgi:glycosyltransferase involved in cell wall biosynthesis
VKPVLFVAGHVPAYRAGALARLHEREGIELALFGGRLRHGGETDVALELPHRRVRPLELGRLAASGDYRAVVVPTAGRVAPLASWAGARRARVPLILWASLWAHPRTAAHALSYLPLRRLYATADAVVTYGPHVSAYVRARGARNVFEAPQSVDNGFWRAQGIAPAIAAWPGEAACRFLFVGRDAPEKGAAVLREAWRSSGLRPPAAALLLVGGEDAAPFGEGAAAAGAARAEQLRTLYAAADVLVVPSVATRTFREPWGLVTNEAMNRSLPVIASDAVGAAAGGLVRDGTNGVVVPAGDSRALAAALQRLASEPQLRARLGAAGAGDVAAYTHEAWAQGFSQALTSLRVGRVHC